MCSDKWPEDMVFSDDGKMLFFVHNGGAGGLWLAFSPQCPWGWLCNLPLLNPNPNPSPNLNPLLAWRGYLHTAHFPRYKLHGIRINPHTKGLMCCAAPPPGFTGGRQCFATGGADKQIFLWTTTAAVQGMNDKVDSPSSRP